jgi:carbohydrate-binding DOMON domain-containing protein
MPQEYTRQRQGRDFALRKTQTQAPDEARIKGETNKTSNETKKSLQTQLEQYKAEAERNAVPIDGHEPPEKGRQ